MGKLVRDYWLIDYLDDGIWTAYDEFQECEKYQGEEAHKIALDCTRFGDGIARYYKGFDGQFGVCNGETQCIVSRDNFQIDENWLYSECEENKIFGGNKMESKQFKVADLSQEELGKVRELEMQLGVSLVAYEGQADEEEISIQ